MSVLFIPRFFHTRIVMLITLGWFNISMVHSNCVCGLCELVKVFERPLGLSGNDTPIGHLNNLCCRRLGWRRSEK